LADDSQTRLLTTKFAEARAAQNSIQQHETKQETVLQVCRSVIASLLLSLLHLFFAIPGTPLLVLVAAFQLLSFWSNYRYEQDGSIHIHQIDKVDGRCNGGRHKLYVSVLGG
jgi:hypothetical protein